MSKKLEDYIKIYRWLDIELCEKIRKELEEVSWKQHVFYNAAGEYVTQSGNRELDVSWDEIPSRAELTQKVWETVSKYILEEVVADPTFPNTSKVKGCLIAFIAVLLSKLGILGLRL